MTRRNTKRTLPRINPENSRYAVCVVGEGYSVEDKRTGNRISYHRTLSGAQKSARLAREELKRNTQEK